MEPDRSPMRVRLTEVVREWGRIGVIGFGGLPVHVALFRERFVRDRGWIEQAVSRRAAGPRYPSPP